MGTFIFPQLLYQKVSLHTLSSLMLCFHCNLPLQPPQDIYLFFIFFTRLPLFLSLQTLAQHQLQRYHVCCSVVLVELLLLPIPLVCQQVLTLFFVITLRYFTSSPPFHSNISLATLITMRKSSRTTGRTPSNTNPNLQDAINNLCPPPPPHSYHQPQHSHHGDPTTPEDHTQVHVVTPTLSSTVPPSSLMDPTSSTTYHAMQVESYGARPSSSIHVDSIVVGSASTIQEHMQENIGQAPPRQRKTGWMSSNVSIGQDQAFNKVCDFLRDDNVGMVGIYGMGGVGKTTLLKKVRKEFLERSHFNVIWIVVSKSIDVDSIQKNIMEEMNLHFNKKELRHKRAKKINKALATNKVGLLFDDIWQSLNMEELGIIGDNDLDTSNFKILFTTRSKKVCTQMDSDKEIIVECLCWDDSWAIFEKCVGKKTLEQADPSVSLLAEKVAKECEGLPLALTVVGRAMTCKYTHQEWKDALNMLQKSRYDVLDPEKNLFNCLKLSYDYLPDHGVKNCFLYCCLFPEDYEMTSSNLAELWVVEGLLAMNGSFMEALNRGYGIIGTLRAACLLEKGGEKPTSCSCGIETNYRSNLFATI